MSGESSNQLRDDEVKWEKPPSKKIKSKRKAEPVTAINDHHYETTRSTITSSLPTFTCDICFKTFPSAKSLHGHMRSHPDRPYRGMLPPNKSNRPTRIYSDDQVVVNGFSLFPCWPPIPKRRRSGGGTGVSGSCSSVNGDEDEESIMSAAYDLMLLATGEDRYRTLPTRLKKDGIRVSEVSPLSNKEARFEEDGGCSGSVEKKRKRENDDEARKCYYSSPSKVSDEVVSASNLHPCKVCNKEYTSGQALGGHMRYHYKPQPVADVVAAYVDDQTPIAEDAADADVVATDQTPIAEDQGALVADVVFANVVAEDEAPTVRSFDLNEFPADI